MVKDTYQHLICMKHLDRWLRNLAAWEETPYIIRQQFINNLFQENRRQHHRICMNWHHVTGWWVLVYLEAFMVRYASTTLSRSSSSILRLPAETCAFAAFLLGLEVELSSCFFFSFSMNKNDLGWRNTICMKYIHIVLFNTSSSNVNIQDGIQERKHKERKKNIKIKLIQTNHANIHDYHYRTFSLWNVLKVEKILK